MNFTLTDNTFSIEPMLFTEHNEASADNMKLRNMEDRNYSNAYGNGNGSENGNSRISFPEKLHQLLTDAEQMGFEHLISWQDSGISFKIHDSQKFQTDIIPQYFKRIKYTSFQRQLSIYGFQRIRIGWNTGGYEHPCFVRGKPELCQHIKRNKKTPVFTSSTDKQQETSSPMSFQQQQQKTSDFDPSFLDMVGPQSINLDDVLKSSIFDFDNSGTRHGNADINTNNSKMTMHQQSQQPQLHDNQNQNQHYNSQNGQEQPPIVLNQSDFEPIPLQLDICNGKPITMDKQSSFSNLLALNEDGLLLERLQSTLNTEDPTKTVSSESSYTSMGTPSTTTTTIMTESPAPVDNTCYNKSSTSKGAFFPAKLHQLLEDAERMNFQHIVSWTNDGESFQIHDQKEFVNKIMTIYFDQTKFASFRRQLNLYGFNRTRTNANRNMYFHEYFLQRDPSLCEKMQRRCAGSTSSGSSNNDTEEDNNKLAAISAFMKRRNIRTN